VKQSRIHIESVRWRRRWFCVAAALFAAVPGHIAFAQALPTGTGPGAYVIAGGTCSEFQADYGSRTINGASIYVDSNLDWRYGIETEARRMAYPDFGERQSTLLAGPRWSFRPKGLVPYAKLLVGGGRFDFPYGYGTGNYFVVAPGAGVDLRLGERVRLRLVDFEYQVWPGFTLGSIHPYGVSMGISYQILGSSRTRMSK
jgi:hypothetical protein